MAYQPPARRGLQNDDNDDERVEVDMAQLTLGIVHKIIGQHGNERHSTGVFGHLQNPSGETAELQQMQHAVDSAARSSPQSDRTVTPISGGVPIHPTHTPDNASTGPQRSPSSLVSQARSGEPMLNSRFFSGGSSRWSTVNAAHFAENAHQSEPDESRSTLPFSGVNSSSHPMTPWTAPISGGTLATFSPAPRRLEDVSRFRNASLSSGSTRPAGNILSPVSTADSVSTTVSVSTTSPKSIDAERQALIEYGKKFGLTFTKAPETTQNKSPVVPGLGLAPETPSPRPTPVLLHRLSPTEPEFDEDHDQEDSRSALRNRRGRAGSIVGGTITERGFGRSDRGESFSRARGRGGMMRYQPPGGPRTYHNRVREPPENFSRSWKAPEVLLQEDWLRLRNSMRRLFPHSDIAKWKFDDYKKHKEAVEAVAVEVKKRLETTSQLPRVPKVILKDRDASFDVMAEAVKLANELFIKQDESYSEYRERVNGIIIVMYPSPEDTSYFLALKTMWCVNWKNGKEEIADWPTLAELKWEGDDRAKTNVGRFLPLPRERGAPGMPWNSLEVIKPYELDRVWLPPTEEDIIAPVDEIPEEVKNQFVHADVWAAIEEPLNY